MATQALVQWVLLFSLIHYGYSQTSTNLVSVGCVGENCYYIVTAQRSWTDAHDICKSHTGTYLATIPDDQSRTFLHKAMTSHNLRVTQMWFGGHEVIYDTWRWLNNHALFKDNGLHEYNNGPNKPFCGVINQKRLEGSICIQMKRYLCTRSDIDMSNPRQESYHISRTNPKTWFQARDDCISHGMDLAIVTSNSTMQLKKLLKGDTHNFWIGLVKSRFVWVHDGTEMRYLHFASNAPNNKAQLCLEMTTGGDYNDDRCDYKKAFVCHKVTSTQQTTTAGQSPPTMSVTSTQQTTTAGQSPPTMSVTTTQPSQGAGQGRAKTSVTTTQHSQGAGQGPAKTSVTTTVDLATEWHGSNTASGNGTSAVMQGYSILNVIAGIVVGIVVLLIIVGIIICCCCYKKKDKKVPEPPPTVTAVTESPKAVDYTATEVD